MEALKNYVSDMKLRKTYVEKNSDVVENDFKDEITRFIQRFAYVLQEKNKAEVKILIQEFVSSSNLYKCKLTNRIIESVSSESSVGDDIMFDPFEYKENKNERNNMFSNFFLNVKVKIPKYNEEQFLNNIQAEYSIIRINNEDEVKFVISLLDLVFRIVIYMNIDKRKGLLGLLNNLIDQLNNIKTSSSSNPQQEVINGDTKQDNNVDYSTNALSLNRQLSNGRSSGFDTPNSTNVGYVTNTSNGDSIPVNSQKRSGNYNTTVDDSKLAQMVCTYDSQPDNEKEAIFKYCEDSFGKITEHNVYTDWFDALMLILSKDDWCNENSSRITNTLEILLQYACNKNVENYEGHVNKLFDVLADRAAAVREQPIDRCCLLLNIISLFLTIKSLTYDNINVKNFQDGTTIPPYMVELWYNKVLQLLSHVLVWMEPHVNANSQYQDEYIRGVTCFRILINFRSPKSIVLPINDATLTLIQVKFIPSLINIFNENVQFTISSIDYLLCVICNFTFVHSSWSIHIINSANLIQNSIKILSNMNYRQSTLNEANKKIKVGICHWILNCLINSCNALRASAAPEHRTISNTIVCDGELQLLFDKILEIGNSYQAIMNKLANSLVSIVRLVNKWEIKKFPYALYKRIVKNVLNCVRDGEDVNILRDTFRGLYL